MKSKEQLIEKILTLGGKFSSEIGINLSQGDSKEIFKWFLASKLFGARIGTTIAIKTYQEFERERLLTPAKITEAGWDGLVRVLDAGGYVRYDYSTATKLLEIMQDLIDQYQGSLNNLHDAATDEKDLEVQLKSLGKGIGDVTVNIFLRELRGIWPKANPSPSPLAELAADRLGLIKPGEDSLKTLEAIWSQHPVSGHEFTDFEAALVRLGKDYCKGLKTQSCPLKSDCGCKKIKGQQ